jgi:membrane associated rhomboid family serine protease
MLYSILQALETAWGDFKFTFFLAVGLIATGFGAIATGMEFGNSMIMLSTFLAFARLMPDREVLVMFVLPVKLRWLALLSVLWTMLDFVTSPMPGRVQILTGLLPYILFFGAGHARDASMAWRRWRNNL